MSESTGAIFRLPKNHKIEHVIRHANKLWDVITIKRHKDDESGVDRLYSIDIGELSLKESFFILDSLKSKYSLNFYIEYGRY